MTILANLERRTTGRAFAVVAALGGVLLIGLGAGMTFFSDEWAFIESRSLADPLGWFRPFQEHWSTLPIILYRLMVETIGIGSYLPYLAVVVSIHLGVAGLVFVLVRRRCGPGPAFLGGMLVLVFGSGFENLFWAFQTGFTGSVLFGLTAMAVTDGEPNRKRAVMVAGLLLLSLMASGMGLIMSVAIGIEWLLEGRWRPHVPWLLIPAAFYGGWYLAFGRGAIATVRSPFTLGALADVPRFVVVGFANAGAAITGLGAGGGLLVVVVIAGWIALRARRRASPARPIGILVAIGVQYGLIALVRGNLFDGQVDYTRYTYVSGILLLVAVGTVVGRPRFAPSARVRPFAIAAVVSVVGLAFAFNLALLIGGRELFLARADMTRALVIAGLRQPLPAETNPDRTLVLVPSPSELRRIVAAYGDPRSDSLVPSAVREIPPDVQAEADRRVRDGAVVPLPEH